MKKAVLLMVALIGLSAASCGDNSSTVTGLLPRTLVVANGTIQVPAGSWNYYQINILGSMTNPHLSGTFTAHGGSGNDIVVLIMTDTEYTNWSNGHSVTPEYNSTQLTTSSFDVALPIGMHYLIYNNTFSPLSVKTVDAFAQLDWES